MKRKRPGRWLRWTMIVLGILAALLAIFYAPEDWGGWHAWQPTRKAWEAKDIKLDAAGGSRQPKCWNENDGHGFVVWTRARVPTGDCSRGDWVRRYPSP